MKTIFNTGIRRHFREDFLRVQPKHTVILGDPLSEKTNIMNRGPLSSGRTSRRGQLLPRIPFLPRKW